MPEERRVLAMSILQYLLRHPDSNDSLVGIAQWWLLDQDIHHTLSDVAAVLEELVAKEWVRKQKSIAGDCFAINRQREKEILEFVQRKK